MNNDAMERVPEGLSAVRDEGGEFPSEATVSQAEVGGQELFTIILRDVNDPKLEQEELCRLELENVYLREEAKTELEFEGIIGTSRAMGKVLGATERPA